MAMIRHSRALLQVHFAVFLWGGTAMFAKGIPLPAAWIWSWPLA